MIRKTIDLRIRRGAAALEFALLLPFLGVAFAAAVDFGRVYYVTQILDQSAYAGALAASGVAHVSSSTSLEDAAKSAACADGTTLTPPLAGSDVVVSIQPSTVQVTVAYDFATITPIQGFVSTIRLNRTIVMNRAPTSGS